MEVPKARLWVEERVWRAHVEGCGLVMAARAARLYVTHTKWRGSCGAQWELHMITCLVSTGFSMQVSTRFRAGFYTVSMQVCHVEGVVTRDDNER